MKNNPYCVQPTRYQLATFENPVGASRFWTTLNTYVPEFTGFTNGGLPLMWTYGL